MKPKVKTYLKQAKWQRQAGGFRDTLASAYKTSRKVNRAYGPAGSKRGLASRLPPTGKTLSKASQDACCKL